MLEKTVLDPPKKVNSLEGYAQALGTSNKELSAALGVVHTPMGYFIPTKAKRRWQGSKWIRRTRRLKIYARDGWRCIWCKCRVAIGARAKAGHIALAHLDHIKPRCQGGSNATENLVTSCKRCNDRRGATPAVAYAKRVGALSRVLEAIGKVL
jgi:hypothetical protein